MDNQYISVRIAPYLYSQYYCNSGCAFITYTLDFSIAVEIVQNTCSLWFGLMYVH